MITMSIPTQSLSPTAAAAGEGLPCADTGEDSATDFADLLAAAFAPVTAPNTLASFSEAQPTTDAAADITAGSSLPASGASYLLTLTSEQQTDFRAVTSQLLQPEAMKLLTRQETVSLSEALMLGEAQSDVTTPQTALAQSDALPTAAVTSFAQFLPLGNKLENAQLTVTETHQASKSFSLADFLHGNELPARAARAVKDIVAEPEAVEPSGQTGETKNFTESESAPLQAEPADAAPTSDAQSTFTAHVQNASQAPIATAITDKSAAQSIVTQTIHPIVDLAQQTAHRETRSLRFDLQPKELGRVEVEVSRDAAGNVSATLNAEHADAAQSLTHNLGHLREALEQAGVKVEHLNVYTSAQFQQQPNGQPQQQHTERTTPLEMLLPETTPEENTTAVAEDKLLNLRA